MIIESFWVNSHFSFMEIQLRLKTNISPTFCLLVLESRFEFELFRNLLKDWEHRELPPSASSSPLPVKIFFPAILLALELAQVSHSVIVLNQLSFDACKLV